jgi:hypothetical protein
MTKQLKIVIFSVITLFVLYVIYSVYTTSKEGSGSFSDFDVNSTANKNIKVELIQEKGVSQNPGGGVVFYAKDRIGIEKKIVLDKELPSGYNNSKTVTLMGHLHPDHFHATEAEID